MNSAEEHRREIRLRLARIAEETQQRSQENEMRFQTWLGEVRADRKRADKERKRADGARAADREEWQRQIAAQNEAIQALLIQMAENSGRIGRLEAS